MATRDDHDTYLELLRADAQKLRAYSRALRGRTTQLLLEAQHFREHVQHIPGIPAATSKRHDQQPFLPLEAGTL
jgi:hypothetical protein